MSKIRKPLCLEMEEAAEEIAKAVNEAARRHNLGYYLLEKIMHGINAQISDGRRRELSEADASYKYSLEEAADKEVST